MLRLDDIRHQIDEAGREAAGRHDRPGQLKPQQYEQPRPGAQQSRREESQQDAEILREHV